MQFGDSTPQNDPASRAAQNDQAGQGDQVLRNDPAAPSEPAGQQDLAPYWDETYTRHLVPASAVAAGQVSTTDGRGRWVLPIIVMVAAVLAVLVAFRVFSGDDASATPQSTAEPSQTAAPIQTGEQGAVDPAPGVVITAAVESDELLEVVETVRWAVAGPPNLFLELSDPTALIGLDNTDLSSQTVANLQVTLDGSPVGAVPDAGSPTRWLVESPSGAAPSTMELRYELSGAVARSIPSTPGRALALFAPLSRSAIGDLPVRVVVTGDAVVSIACPGAPDTASEICGRQSGDTWTAEPVPGDLHVVMVQLNLPSVA